eukprot:m.141881 g.141881  ORF g.141881 m.141881 type:complete len:379 (+) comp15986_c2_seq1:334-1470(+)
MNGPTFQDDLLARDATPPFNLASASQGKQAQYHRSHLQPQRLLFESSDNLLATSTSSTVPASTSTVSATSHSQMNKPLSSATPLHNVLAMNSSQEGLPSSSTISLATAPAPTTTTTRASKYSSSPATRKRMGRPTPLNGSLASFLIQDNPIHSLMSLVASPTTQTTFTTEASSVVPFIKEEEQDPDAFDDYEYQMKQQHTPDSILSHSDWGSEDDQDLMQLMGEDIFGLLGSLPGPQHQIEGDGLQHTFQHAFQHSSQAPLQEAQQHSLFLQQHANHSAAEPTELASSLEAECPAEWAAKCAATNTTTTTTTSTTSTNAKSFDLCKAVPQSLTTTSISLPVATSTSGSTITNPAAAALFSRKDNLVPSRDQQQQQQQR